MTALPSCCATVKAESEAGLDGTILMLEQDKGMRRDVAVAYARVMSLREDRSERAHSIVVSSHSDSEDVLSGRGMHNHVSDNVTLKPDPELPARVSRMSLAGLVSGAECAVQVNPLSQVLKHTDGDRSLLQVCLLASAMPRATYNRSFRTLLPVHHHPE